ncbi:ATP-binding cassette domain-containing protein [Streptomyces sp. NPDC005805]|uniref:ABC transporter ATP-binding protein n=1 Tax=Streptomyces sp. NPDC005805 TaxID=3157068 RepID=UPI0033F9E438
MRPESAAHAPEPTGSPSPAPAPAAPAAAADTVSGPAAGGSAADAAPAFELVGLTKSFNGRPAADAVTLSVPRGRLLGLVGPNGAGKTTSLSMAVGLLRPDAGTARVLDVDVWERPEEAKRLLGVLPDGLALPERLTGAELLLYWGRLRELDDEVVRARTAELLRVLELEEAEASGTLVVEYSTGMRKKIGLATALLHAPKVLVLDEPYEAVDPVSARVLTTILRRFTAAGGSVVVSSHVMPLVERLCDRVALIADGRVRADDTLAEVSGDGTLEDAFVRLVGRRDMGEEELSWLG